MAKEKKGSVAHQVFTVIGIVLCVILIPILIMNCILLVKGVINQEEVPSVGGIFPMIVLTDSMSGTFESGDLIICQSVSAGEVKVGDVITFFDPAGSGSSVVSHRVTEITEENGQLAFMTWGDSNNSPDRLPVPAEKLIGRYIDIRIPGAGHVAIFMQSPAGLIVCVVLPLLLLVGYDALRRYNYNKKHDADKQALMSELEELRKMKEEMNRNKEEKSHEEE